MKQTPLIPRRRYIDELERVKSLPEVVSMVDEYRPLMSYLTNHTGELINDTDDMWILYHNLVSEQAVGLELPEWTQEVFPDGELRDATILEYDIFSYNDLLKRINGGTDSDHFMQRLVQLVTF